MKTLLTSKLGQSVIVVAVIAGGMLVTNPDKPAYVDYAATKLVEEIKNSWCDTPAVSNNLGSWQDVAQDMVNGLGDICKGVVTTSGAVGVNPVKNVIDSSTIRQNFFLFSIYETDIAQKNFRTLGVLGNFFTFSVRN